MALKAILDSLDDVDTNFHEHYRRDDKLGKFVLDIEDVDSHPRTRALKDEAAQRRIALTNATKSLEVFKPFGTVEELQAKLDRFDELEALASSKTIDEDKINSLVETRIKSKLAPVERERDSLKQNLTQLTEENNGYKAKDRSRVITDAVRSAIGKSQGFQKVAEEDAILWAERHLDIDESGNVVTRDNVGVTPGVDPSVWLTEMQRTKSHWWGASSGGGATGSGRANTGPNPWTADSWNMTEQGRLYRENPQRAEQLAKSAGSMIGGQRPKPKT